MRPEDISNEEEKTKKKKEDRVSDQEHEALDRDFPALPPIRADQRTAVSKRKQKKGKAKEKKGNRGKNPEV